MKTFDEMFRDFDTNYMVLWPGPFKYYIRRKIVVAYMDKHSYIEDRFVGLNNLEINDIEYSNLIVIKPTSELVKKISDEYSIIVIEINRRDFNKFKNCTRFLLCQEYRNKNTNYFLALLELFNLKSKQEIIFKENEDNLKAINRIIKREYIIEKEVIE